MKGYIVIALLIGILIGFGMNLIYFKLTEPTKSWHYVTSFILASCNREDVEIAYSYPNVYNTTSPSFTVKGDFWRIRWETLPYYNWTGGFPKHPIVYYAPVPSVLGVFKDEEVVGLIEVFEPSAYNVTHWGFEGAGDKIDVCYALTWDYGYVPIRSPYTLMTGKGTYYISAQGIARTRGWEATQSITGCFNFAIEEYY
jgi:hypothetical protein